MQAKEVTESGYYWCFRKNKEPTIVRFDSDEDWFDVVGDSHSIWRVDMKGEVVGPLVYPPLQRPLQDELVWLRAQVEALERLRPLWAKGFTDEAVAAQVLSAALAQIRGVLNTTDQTSTMERLRKLLFLECLVEQAIGEKFKGEPKNVGEKDHG